MVDRQRQGEVRYQLTHDYLVPPLRQWLFRKQRETRRGRAELRLAACHGALARPPGVASTSVVLRMARDRLFHAVSILVGRRAPDDAGGDAARSHPSRCRRGRIA